MSLKEDLLYAVMHADSEKAKGDYTGEQFEAMQNELQKGENPGGGSGGGTPAPKVNEKDVNFYDYDGTLLHSYTVAEAQALKELPELPEREGLICQGWNYELETIKEYNRAVDVGATYITDDGKTRLYINIPTYGRMDMSLYFKQTVTNGVTIDWGDGSDVQTVANTGSRDVAHTYTSIGDYVITLDVADGCELSLGWSSNSYCIVGSTSDSNATVRYWLKKIEIGKNTSIPAYAFGKLEFLESVTIPEGVTSIGLGAFNNCNLIKIINLPKGMTSIGDNAFSYCRGLIIATMSKNLTSIGKSAFSFAIVENFVIHDGVNKIEQYSFSGNYLITKLAMPESVTSIGASAFNGCRNMRCYDFTKHTAVPTLSAPDAFTGIPSNCEIRVPAALADEWKAATNWATYADKIVAV